MAAAAILNFGKNVNNFGLDKDTLDQIIWEDASRPCRDDHLTKCRNRKLIHVTSSNEGLKHMCVDLGAYNRYLNQIWHRIQIPQCLTRRNGQIHKLKIQDGGGRHLEFQKKMSITLDWTKKKSASNYTRRCTTAMRKLVRVT